MRKSEKFVINYYNHPKFLTKVQKVFHLILKHHHKLVDHSGQGIALKKIRSLGYWIVDANSAAKNLVLKSYQCRKYRGTVWEQKLSNLPFFRLSGTSSLTYCGKDVFGPTVVKQKISETKRYGNYSALYSSCFQAVIIQSCRQRSYC